MKFRITRDHGPYKKGQVHEPKPENVYLWRGRDWAVPYKGGDVETSSRAPQESAALEPWTLSTSPAEYLEKYPDGPNAELARAHEEEGG